MSTDCSVRSFLIIIIIIIIITLFKLLKMYQFVKNKLVLIHEQRNIIFLNYIKMIMTGKIHSFY